MSIFDFPKKLLEKIVGGLYILILKGLKAALSYSKSNIFILLDII
jgi:hypothetical protein